jgi:hypothetical protein
MEHAVEVRVRSCCSQSCPTVSVAPIVVRMRGHQPTIDYVWHRTAEIVRCLKRFVVREIFGHPCCPTKPALSNQNVGFI